MKLRNSILAICAALVASSFATLAGEDNNAPDSKIDNLLHATSTSELARAYRQLFDNTLTDDLPKLIANSNTSISMAAAWERVRRKVPNGYRADKVRPDPEVVSRFLGVVEGCTQVPLPQAWENAIRSTKARGRNDFVFDTYFPTNAVMRPGVININGTAAGETRKEGNRCIIEMPDKKWSFELERGTSDVDNVTIAMAGATAIVAPSEWPPMPYLLYAVQPDTGTVNWSTSVWCAGDFCGYEGQGSHHVNLKLRDQEVFVFGFSENTAYIEWFDLKTGKNLGRFGTGYFQY